MLVSLDPEQNSFAELGFLSQPVDNKYSLVFSLWLESFCQPVPAQICLLHADAVVSLDGSGWKIRFSVTVQSC